MRSMAINLILQEKITTTKTRARQVASFVERLITKAKRNDLASKRVLASILPSVAVKKILAIATRFKDRQGGYTRIVRLGQRLKDGAPLVVVELLDRPVAAESSKKEGEKKVEKKSKKQAAKDKEEK